MTSFFPWASVNIHPQVPWPARLRPPSVEMVLDWICLLYSIGSNNEIGFEKSIKEFVGCEIHTFDPTLRQAFIGGEYATFHPWALGTDGQVVQFAGID